MPLESEYDGGPATELELIIVREFAAPLSLVWKAWTEPEYISQWFGPRGFSTRVEYQELSKGGKWRWVMIGPDGAEYPMSGVYLEFDPERRMVSTDEWDEGFEEKMGMELPKGMVVTTLFEALGDRTRVTIRTAHTDLETKRMHEEMGVVAGWNSSFECLDELLLMIRN